MNLWKFVSAMVIVLTGSLTLSFLVNAMGNASVRHTNLLFAALVVSLIATGITFHCRSRLRALILGSCLVANVHLLVVAALLLQANLLSTASFVDGMANGVVSLSGGSLLANVVSVLSVVIEAAWGGD